MTDLADKTPPPWAGQAYSLATSANPRDVDLCYAAGANAYHVKPVRYREHVQLLLDVFGYWLARVTLPAPKRVTR